jgi:hypothetical protein
MISTNKKQTIGLILVALTAILIIILAKTLLPPVALAVKVVSDNPIKASAPVPTSAMAPLQYRSFSWSEPSFSDERSHQNQILVTYVDFPFNNSWHALNTNGLEMTSLDGLLDLLSSHGWRLLLFDGSRYIMVGNQDSEYGNDFTVERRWKDLP